MENKFKQLIVDAYEKAKKGCLVGIIYNAISTYGFSDITDIKGFVESCNPDMLWLKSKKSEIEKNIYGYDLENYRVDDKAVYIKCKNKEEFALEY